MSLQPGILTILLALLIGIDPAQAGRLYEWTDENGTRHYSDQAPQMLPYREREVRPASGGSVKKIEPGIRAAERRLLERARDRDVRIKQGRLDSVQALEERRENCRRAKAHYEETMHRPRSAGGGDRRALRKAMNRVCD